MNTRIAAALILSLATMSTAQEFKFATYNIRQGKGQTERHTPGFHVSLPFGIGFGIDPKPLPVARGAGQLDKIADDLRRMGADVIALQEVNDRSLQSLGRDQAGYLADKLHMQHAYAVAHSDGWIVKKQGNAILSRWPIKEKKLLELNRAQGESERRIALFARVMIPGFPDGVWCCSTHTSSDSAELREVSAAKFIAALKKLTGPAILAGDFNAVPEAKSMTDLITGSRDAGRGLTDAYAAVGNGPGGTSSAPEGKARIDYILTTPELMPVNAHAPHDVNTSDHFPVVATIKPRVIERPAEVPVAGQNAETSLLGVSTASR